MRFLVDECTGPKVAKWLLAEGHEVISVFDESQGSPDLEVPLRALAEDWILITNDKDFGELVFREQLEHHGVILLRLDDERAANKIIVLQHLLANYGDKLPDHFVTVTETKVRFS